MRLIGRMTTELRDAKTGRIAARQKDKNIITAAIPNLLNILPEMIKGSTYYGQFLRDNTPIYGRLFGGILLFDAQLQEDAGTIYPPAAAGNVGHAGSAYGGANTYRGTYNANESGQIPGGWRHVWDFGTDKANGTTRCAALTSKMGGDVGYANSIVDPSISVFSFPHSISGYLGNNSLHGFAVVNPNDNQKIFLGCFAQNTYTYVTVSGTTATFYDYVIPKASALALTDSYLSTDTYMTQTLEIPFYQNPLYWFLCDDGNLLYISRVSADTLNYLKINPITKTIAYQTQITLTGATDINISGSAICAEYDGRLFVQTNADSRSFYIVDLATSQIIDTKTFDYSLHAPYILGGRLYFPGNKSNSTTIDALTVYNGLTFDLIPLFGTAAYKIFPSPFVNQPYILANNQSSSDRSAYLMASANYLASVNNLASPITKNPTQTLKVIYEISQI